MDDEDKEVKVSKSKEFLDKSKEHLSKVASKASKKVKRGVPFSKWLMENPWRTAAGVLAIITVVLYFVMASSSCSGISKSEAGNIMLDLLKSRVGDAVKVDSIKEMGNSLYEVDVVYQGGTVPLYITSDGKYIVSAVLPVTTLQENKNNNPQTQEIEKSDKPKIELFVMTYCPYGTQMEKGILPVLKTLGNKIDATIRFVHYFMHGDKEEQETYRQLCIREEQPSKFLDYLSCFLEDGNASRCMNKVGVDINKVKECEDNGNAKKYYEKDSELSQKYGVQGSPTLIINEKEISSGRSSSALLSTICSAFNNEPSECSEELSAETPSPGFGYSESSSGASGSCG